MSADRSFLGRLRLVVVGDVHGRRGAKDLVVGFDVELDFFACQGADSGRGVSWE